MRLTLKHLADWKQKPDSLSFTQYVDKKVTGTDKALVKPPLWWAHGRNRGVRGGPPARRRPGRGAGQENPAWIAHFEGFTKEFQKARINSGGLPKNRKGIPEDNLAMKESANAVIPESEKQVNEYCAKAGPAQRQNLAAWMEHLDKAGGLYQSALDMVYRVATGGKSLPKRKP